jgi:hypothetical protein
MKTNTLLNRCNSAAQVPVEFCRKVVAGVVELKDRLIKQYEAALPGQSLLVNRAVEEAEELAWETPFPHLFLPDFVELRIAQLAPAYALARAA